MADEPPAETGRTNDRTKTGRTNDRTKTARKTSRAKTGRTNDRSGTGHDRQAQADQEHGWFDDEAGPVVRPYTVTGGRARPATGGLDLLSFVEARYAPDADLIDVQPEHRAILAMTREALSVAEIAALLDLPVGVVKVLVGDLLQANLVSTFDSDSAMHPPDANVLQAVIDGLRAL